MDLISNINNYKKNINYRIKIQYYMIIDLKKKIKNYENNQIINNQKIDNLYKLIFFLIINNVIIYLIIFK